MQPVADVSVGTMADVEAVMKKYDRESNVRIWEGLPRRLIDWLMAAFAVYCIVDAIFLTTLQEIRYSVFLGMVERPNHMPWYDVVILLAGSGAFFFYAVNAMTVIRLSAKIMADPLFMTVGIIGILALVELCRRCVGLPILCVAGVLILYALLSGIRPFQMVRTLFYTANGIFSTPVAVCVKYIAIFIIFGAFLERTGVADFFIRSVKLRTGDLPPVLDIETRPKDVGKLRRDLKIWLDRIERHYGVKPILYTSYKFKTRYLNDSVFNSYPYWIAHYYVDSVAYEGEWKFWQHTDVGTLPGIDRQVDLNVFNGTMEEMNELRIGRDSMALEK